MKVRTLVLATAIAVCMSPAAWAAQVDKAGGAMRQESPRAPQPDKMSEQERRAMESQLGEKPDPSALPHHQLNTRWRWHYRNTTTKAPKKIKEKVDTVDKDDAAAMPHHQPTSRWSRHHRNTTTKPDKK